MTHDAYASLAEWFEYLNADCDYEKWSQYLYERLCGLGISAGRGLDIGCGSGAFTRRLARKGFAMTGYDISAGMLAKAEALSAKEGVFPQYVLADARKVHVLGGRADFAVCVNDCLNYIPAPDISSFFKRMAACLRKGGALLFDVSSPYKLREIIGNNTFCEDRDELAYLWFNTLFEDRVEMEITLFVRGADARFSREEERHVQYIHEATFLRSAAESAGFTVHGIEGAFGDKSDRTRLNFICTRR